MQIERNEAAGIQTLKGLGQAPTLPMRRGRQIWPWLVACSVFAMPLMMATSAWADIPQPQSVLQSIIDQFQSAAGSWEPVLQQYALGLFWLLAGIEFAWTGIKLVLEGADFKQFAGELIRRIIFIGFFLAVLLNASSWSSAIINSLRQAGQNASSAGGGVTVISPDNVFTAGLEVASQVSQTVSFWHAESSLALLIASIIIVIVFALLAAMLMLALIEMYIAINAGVILLGFGGCSWTSDFAKKYLTYCVSVGMKLMVIQLLIGLGQQMVLNWCSNMTNIQQSNQEILAIIGASIAMYALVKSVPDILQGLITGVSVNAHTGLLTVAAAAGGAALAAGGMAAGAGMAVTEAAKSGWQQSAGGAAGTMGGISGGGGSGGGGSPGKGGFPGLAGGFARVASAAYLGAGALGRAAASDVGGRITGANRGFGTMGGRMAADMRKERLGDTKQSTGEGGAKAKTGVSGNISPGGDEI